jgi:hypothetical protein
LSDTSRTASNATSTNVRLLSEIVLARECTDRAISDPSVSGRIDLYPARIREQCSALGPQDLEELEALATSNHVVVRFFEPLQRVLITLGNSDAAERVGGVLERERGRIDHALGFLERICGTLAQEGSPVTIIKSLDHWPDLGSDLDLYTDANPARIIALMSLHFKARPDIRSWGDRLASKWNFIVPGLPELVEVHAGRLGQMGEQTAITRSLAARARIIQLGAHQFSVAAPEDRIVISTLQRMYRHFYIRLCDIADNAQLVGSGVVDFAYLRWLSSAAGLWEGIATYLTIVSEYVERYRGEGIALPASVRRSAKFGADDIRYRSKFLRVPIVPHSAILYARELKSFLFRGDLRNSLRLGLMPCLATAAALEYRFTGSDKGIW